MTLKQKREIVRRFKAGESINHIQVHESCRIGNDVNIDKVLRDYLNGKFKLAEKPKEPSE